MATGSSPEEVQDHWSAAWRQGVRARLAKKATFEAAVADLEKALRASPAAASDPAVAELIERSFTLLRTRYTAPGFWNAGRALYASAAQAVAGSASSGHGLCLARYAACVKACDEHLCADAPAESPAERPPPLFEGQHSHEADLPPQRRGLEELLALAALRFPPAPGEDRGTSEGGAEPAGAAPAPLPPAELDAALQRELEEAIAASLADAEAGGARPGGPPPAAAYAVRALRSEALTAERLAALGGPGVECCVCRRGPCALAFAGADNPFSLLLCLGWEELAVGQSVQVMPCNAAHAFHPPCLKPWLAAHNSCPICRHELPTADERYERRKVREAQEAEDRKGAANAVTHTDFLYT